MIALFTRARQAGTIIIFIIISGLRSCSWCMQLAMRVTLILLVDATSMPSTIRLSLDSYIVYVYIYTSQKWDVISWFNGSIYARYGINHLILLDRRCKSIIVHRARIVHASQKLPLEDCIDDDVYSYGEIKFSTI